MSTQVQAQKASTGEEQVSQFCTFWVGERWYGVDILEVQEVNPVNEVTTVYHTPEEVSGFVNIRGKIYLILDLGLMLGLQTVEQSGDALLVLFKEDAGQSFGVRVDRIGETVQVQQSSIEDRRTMEQEIPDGREKRKGGNQFTRGICKLQNDLLVILDGRRFIPFIERKTKQITFP